MGTVYRVKVPMGEDGSSHSRKARVSEETTELTGAAKAKLIKALHNPTGQ